MCAFCIYVFCTRQSALAFVITVTEILQCFSNEMALHIVMLSLFLVVLPGDVEHRQCIFAGIDARSIAIGNV